MPKPLGEILLSQGIITEEQLQDALKEQRKTAVPLGEILKAKGLITDAQLQSALKAQRQLPAGDWRQMPLGEILVSMGAISRQDLERALEEQQKEATGSRRIGEILVSGGYCTRQDIANAIERQSGIKFIDLNTYPIDPKAVYLVPEHIIRRQQVLPIKIEDNILTVAMVSPQDISTISEIELLTGYKVKAVLVSELDLERAIGYYFKVGAGAGGEAVVPSEIAVEWEAIGGSGGGRLPETVGAAEGDVAAAAEELISSVPVVRVVDSIIRGALERRATDVHLDANEDTTLSVRLRIDGELHDYMTIPKELRAGVISRLMVLAGMNIAELMRPQDGHIRMRVAGKTLDLRVATAPTVCGTKANIRIYDRSLLLGIDRLGIEPPEYKIIEELISRRVGMLLAVGPMGCGKTTTLYAILTRLSDGRRSIITIEDPVEFRLAGVSQMEVNPRAGLTFATGLRSILRQDPDVLMVGEIRDTETAQIAVHAALVGHLLLSTLHTADTCSAVERLLVLGIEPFMVSAALSGVIAQRLLRCLCENCKQAYKPADSKIAGIVELPANLYLYKPKGCRSCNNTGYSGRIGIFEVLKVDEGLKQLILDGKPKPALQAYASSKGMRSLLEVGIEKVLQGLTSVEELLQQVYALPV